MPPSSIPPPPRVVIIGGGFGGLLCAKGLIPACRRGEITLTLLDRRNHHLFQPLLYQVATAGLSPAEIAMPIRSVLSGVRGAEVLLGEVTGIDRAARRVQLRDRLIPYDLLVVATGARHSYFGHDQWEQSAPGLKSLVDATRIRQKVLTAFERAETEEDPTRQAALLTFVLVGAGPTGVEMAGAIAELAHQALARDFKRADLHKTRILLVEAGPRVLASFPESLSRRALRSLERLGVEVRLGARVEDVDAQGVIVSGARIAAHTVIWTAGVRASGAARWLNAAADPQGRVLVNERMELPGHPEIFVIGDTAHCEEDGKPLPGVATVAMQQGRYVARLIRARVTRRREPKAFRYWDKGSMATIGRKSAVAAIGRIRLWGTLAWLAWLLVHIYYLIGFRNRVFVLIQWAWAYLAFQRGARIIPEEE